jgi:hypothetical protein
VVVVLLFTGCTIGKEAKHPAWKNATGAEQYERLMWKSIHEKEWKEVEYHLASTFVGVNAQGLALDRDGWVEYWKSAKIKELSLGDFSVQPSGTHMVVTFVLRLSSDTPDSTGGSSTFRVISTWQQVKAGWILTATSLTPVITH